jgi:hypothetical protein
MTWQEHIRQAELLLVEVSERPYDASEDRLVMATMAVAHAMLATALTSHVSLLPEKF